MKDEEKIPCACTMNHALGCSWPLLTGAGSGLRAFSEHMEMDPLLKRIAGLEARVEAVEGKDGATAVQPTRQVHAEGACICDTQIGLVLRNRRVDHSAGRGAGIAAGHSEPKRCITGCVGS